MIKQTMNDEDDDYEILKKAANLYFRDQRLLHIKLKSGTFRNGVITYIGADFIELSDKKLGHTYVFFQEIFKMEPYIQREEKEGDNTRGS